jgi:hypothetical protein
MALNNSPWLMLMFLAEALLAANAMTSVAARPARMSLLRMWCCLSGGKS